MTSKSKLLILSLLILIFPLMRCSDGYTAKVTIYLNQPKLTSNDTLFDKILMFLGRPANAGCSASTTAYNSLTLTITGPDMDPITANIAPSETSYTTEVPAGNKRIFTIIASNESGTRVWGGHNGSDLIAGQELSITIKMYPIPFLASAINWYVISTPVPTGYNIYRSLNPDGPYAFLAYALHDIIMCYYIDDTAIFPTIYYYKISAVYPGAEGEMSDFKTGTEQLIKRLHSNTYTKINRIVMMGASVNYGAHVSSKTPGEPPCATEEEDLREKTASPFRHRDYPLRRA